METYQNSDLVLALFQGQRVKLPRSEPLHSQLPSSTFTVLFPEISMRTSMRGVQVEYFAPLSQIPTRDFSARSIPFRIASFRRPNSPYSLYANRFNQARCFPLNKRLPTGHPSLCISFCPFKVCKTAG